MWEGSPQHFLQSCGSKLFPEAELKRCETKQAMEFLSSCSDCGKCESNVYVQDEILFRQFISEVKNKTTTQYKPVTTLDIASNPRTLPIFTFQDVAQRLVSLKAQKH